MPTHTATFFISAVTDEFSSYRDALATLLDRPGVRIETREKFLLYGDATLLMLDDYIQQCDAVIHLAGDRTGGEETGGVASGAARLGSSRRRGATNVLLRLRKANVRKATDEKNQPGKRKGPMNL